MANITDCDNTKQQRENTGFVEDPQPLSESLPSHRITQCQQESEESVEPEPGIWRRETEYTLLSATSGTSRTTITQASGPHPHISSLDSRLMKPVLSLRDTPRSQRSRDSEAEVERWRTAVSEQAENDADPLPGSGVHSRRPSENEIVLKQEERENQSTLPPESPPQFEHHPVLHNSSPRAPIPDDFRGIGSHLPHSTIPEDGSKNDGCLGHTQCEGDGAPPSPVDTLSGISCAGDGGTEVSLQVSSSIECLNSMTPITCVSRDVEDLIPTTIRLLQETCTHELPIRSRPADGNGYGGRTGNFDQASGTNWPERGNPSGHGCPPTQSSNAFPPSRMPRSPDDGEDGDDDDGDGDDDPNPSPSGGRASKPYLPCPFKVKYPSLACRDFPYMTRLRAHILNSHSPLEGRCQKCWLKFGTNHRKCNPRNEPTKFLDQDAYLRVQKIRTANDDDTRWAKWCELWKVVFPRFSPPSEDMSLQAAFDGFPGFPHFPPLPAQFLVQPSAHPAPDLIPSTPVNMTSPVVFSPSGCLHPKDGHPTSGMYTAHTPTMAHPVQVSISDESRYHSVASSAGQEGRDQFLKASGRSSTNLTVPDPESPTAGRGNSAQGLPETDTLEQRRATHASEFKIPADQHEQAICSLRAGLMDLDRECNFDEWFEMQVVHIDRISQAKRQMENKFESLLCSLKAEDLD